MDKQLHDLRKSYEKNELIEDNLHDNPIDQFNEWFNIATKNKKIEEANAMCISTLNSFGFISSRVVLLKEIADGNLIFYTNYTSNKAAAIENHNKLSIHFFWPELERQVCIEAIATRTSQQKSEEYFNKRPRASQIGAWVSDQSNPINSRKALDNKLQKIEDKYKYKDVPKPSFWGGYECQPVKMEFWQGRPSRLHDRIVYTKSDAGNWTKTRLQP